MRRAPPPSSSAPQMSLEALEVVKKKVSAPPRGPPPAGMTINFKGPRQVERRAAKQDDRYDDDRDQYDNDRDRYDDRDRGYNDRRDNNNRGDDRDIYDRRDHRETRDHYDRRDSRDSRDHYHSDEDDDRDRYYNDDYDDDDHRHNRDRDYRDDDRRNSDEGSDNQNRFNHPQQQKQQQQHQHHRRSRDENDDDFYSVEADGKDYDLTQQHRNQQHANSHQHGDPPVKQRAPPSPEAKASTASNSAASGTSAAAMTVATGRKAAIFNFHPILKSTYRELRHFVLSPCQPGFIVRCYIERNRSGSNMLAPCYSLCADLEDGTGRELVVCRKVWQSRTSHYVFSLKNEDLWRRREQRSRLYLGKLRSVGQGEYVLYDNGICAAPDEDETILEDIEETAAGTLRSDVGNTNIARKLERDRAAEAKNAGAKTSEEVSLYRREMAVIKFNAMNRPAPQCVRGLEVCIPAVPSPAALAEAKPMSSSAAAALGASVTSSVVAQPAVFNLEKPFRKIRDMQRQNDLYGKTCLVLHERASRYDPLSACLVEFKGRAHMASIKNFQMVVSDAQGGYGLPSPGAHEQMMRADGDKDFVFMMGKTTEDCFNMDFKYPLSLFQAFAIAIARFDAKLSW